MCSWFDSSAEATTTIEMIFLLITSVVLLSSYVSLRSLRNSSVKLWGSLRLKLRLKIMLMSDILLPWSSCFVNKSLIYTKSLLQSISERKTCTEVRFSSTLRRYLRVYLHDASTSIYSSLNSSSSSAAFLLKFFFYYWNSWLSIIVFT